MTDSNSSLRLLIAEDDPQVADTLHERLSKEGYQISLAKDGAVALELIEEQEHFDALISDHEMPKVTGIEVVQAFHQKFPQSRACLFTSNPDGDVVMGLNGCGL